MFRSRAVNIWDHEMPVRFGGIPLWHRMTVIRLNDGGPFTRLDVASQGGAQHPSAKVGVTRIKVILFRLHHGCVETHVSISVQKTNIPIAAPNINSGVTATTTRQTNELGCFCMMVRLQAMIRMPTNKNGELFPKDLP